MSSEDPKTGSSTLSSELEPRQEMKRDVTELVKMVVLFLLVFWGLKAFVIEGYEVQGDSMIPTLEDRERILVLKLPTMIADLPFIGGFQPMNDGDIVVFESSVENNKRYIKRIIAQGPPLAESGNTVDAREVHKDQPAPDSVQVIFDKGSVFVNNRRLDEPYLVSEEQHSPDVRDPVYLGAGEYYVLGDHRSVSKDSRSFEAVNESQIIGRAVLRIWPLSSFGLL
jgi:signal peptidase I